MITIKRELNDKEKKFLSGFVAQDSASAYVSSLKDEKLVKFLDQIDEIVALENYSDNLIDMLSSARQDGRITERQVEWWQRELRARCG